MTHQNTTTKAPKNFGMKSSKSKAPKNDNKKKNGKAPLIDLSGFKSPLVDLPPIVADAKPRENNNNVGSSDTIINGVADLPPLEETMTRQTKNENLINSSVSKTNDQDTILTTPFHSVPFGLNGKVVGQVDMNVETFLAQCAKQVEMSAEVHDQLMVQNQTFISMEVEKKLAIEKEMHRLTLDKQERENEILKLKNMESTLRERRLDAEKKAKEDAQTYKENMSAAPGLLSRSELLKVGGLDSKSAKEVVDKTRSLITVEIDAAAELDLHKSRRKIENDSNLRIHNANLLQAEKWRVGSTMKERKYIRMAAGLSDKTFNEFNYVNIILCVLKCFCFFLSIVVKDWAVSVAVSFLLGPFFSPYLTAMHFASICYSAYAYLMFVYICFVDLLPRWETITLSAISQAEADELVNARDVDMRAEEFSLVASKLRANYQKFERKKSFTLFIYLLITTGSTDFIKTGYYEHEIFTQILNQGHLRPGRELKETITSIERALSTFQTIATNREVEYSRYATLNTGMLLGLIVPQVVSDLGNLNSSF